MRTTRPRFTLSERFYWFLFTFVLTIATLAFEAHFAFGFREALIGMAAAVVLGLVVALAADWVREVIFWIFFP